MNISSEVASFLSSFTESGDSTDCSLNLCLEFCFFKDQMNIYSGNDDFLGGATEIEDSINSSFVGRLQWVFPANSNLLR
jgi:hypothetical protein